MFEEFKLWSGLVRLSHTVFALPFALAGLLIGSGGLPTFRTFLLVLGCMVTARNAAMAWNRLMDRDIDLQNERTRRRHLPAGLVTPRAVAIFVAVNAALFVLFAALLNPLCFALSPVALLLVLGYTQTKRFTALCHAALGLAIGVSPLAAAIAASGHFLAVPTLLGATLLFWMTGFDIVYATQDESDDRTLGLHSVPAALGRDRALRLAAVLHAVVPPLLWLCGRLAGWGAAWNGICLLIAALLLWMHLFRKGDDLSMQDGFFRANALVSLLVFLGTAWEMLLRG
jgi:4-hydroxybenzoate polyprenyltransferase